MREIVFVIGNYKNGGVAMRATNLANEFAKAGRSVTLLATKEIGKNIYFDRHSGVNLTSVHEYNAQASQNERIARELSKAQKQLATYRRIRSALQFFQGIKAGLDMRIWRIKRGELLRPFLLGHRDAIVICFGIENYERAFCAAEGLDCKLIFAEKNASQLEFPKDEKEQDRLIELLRFASATVLQTEGELDFFKGRLTNAVVIHNPIKQGLPEPYVGIRRPVVANFCRISPQKNLGLLVQAFRRLHKDYPQFSLEIYGNAVEAQEENLRDELIRQINEAGESDYIRILPPAADVHERIRDCAMFVSSSDFEGLSNSMIEAMAIGMPCVCTDCLGGGAREMINSGENGILVPMKDEMALYLGMKQFIDDPELAKKCGENASKVRDDMYAEAIGGKWLELIERIEQ